MDTIIFQSKRGEHTTHAYLFSLGPRPTLVQGGRGGILHMHIYYPRAQVSRVIGERSEPLSREFNDQPRDIYIDGVRTYVQNASSYFSKLKLCSPIIVRTYVILAL